ncbi:Zn(2)-C6 fungal-type domain-containing protein [Rhodotorula toruloides]|nr:Zn(2)-C6 fungal-type domain-containing protein [Rhodotorula toruloides]
MPPPTQREATPEQEEVPPVAAEPAPRPPRQLFPSFPDGAASYRTNKVASDTREALTRTVTHGIDAPFEKIALQGVNIAALAAEVRLRSPTPRASS